MPIGAGLRQVKRRDHLQDHRAVLDRGDPAGVEGAAVAGAFHLELDGDAVDAAAHEVQVERLREFDRVDGGARGAERLGGDETAEQPRLVAEHLRLGRHEGVPVAVELQQLRDPALLGTGHDG